MTKLQRGVKSEGPLTELPAPDKTFKNALLRTKEGRLSQSLVPLVMRCLAGAWLLCAMPTPPSCAASAQKAYIKASNTGSEDQFGSVVAVSGDTMVVGAPNEDSSAVGVNGDQSGNGAANSGAAYVYVRNGTNWTQQAYLKASNTGASDLFGIAVAISGDTIVVGANNESSNAIGVNGDQANNSALGPGQPTFSSAPARTGRNRLI